MSPITLSSWARPSLSRHFALLVWAIAVVLITILVWVTWVTQSQHSSRILEALNKETQRIERILANEFGDAENLMLSLSREIVAHDTSNYEEIARLLKNFDTKVKRYALWAWANAEDQVVVSSNQGVMDETTYVGDRDYMQEARLQPGTVAMGKPIQGRVSKQWIIPTAIGVSDNTGKYQGTLILSLDIYSLSKDITEIVERAGISFTIFNQDFIQLTEVTNNPSLFNDIAENERFQTLVQEDEESGVIEKSSIFDKHESYIIFRHSNNSKYITLVAYDGSNADYTLQSLLWPRLTQIAASALLLLLFLWIIRQQVIAPTEELSAISMDIARGKRYRVPQKKGPQELMELAEQLKTIDAYLQERKNVEIELRSKLSDSKRREENTQLLYYERSSLLMGLLGECKTSLQAVNGFAQVMKDQMYGPIENKKYRQYASDIHLSGVEIEYKIQDMLALFNSEISPPMHKSRISLHALFIDTVKKFTHESEVSAASPVIWDESEPLLQLLIDADKNYCEQGIIHALKYLEVFQQANQLYFRFQKLSPDFKQYNMVTCIISAKPADAIVDAELLEAYKETDIVTFMDNPHTFQEQLHYVLSSTLLKRTGVRVNTFKNENNELLLCLFFPVNE